MQSSISTPAMKHRLMLALGISFGAHLAVVSLPYGGGRQDNGSSRAARVIEYRIIAAQDEAPAAMQVGALEIDAAVVEASHQQSPATQSAQLHEEGPLPIAAPAFYSADQLSKRPALLSDDPLDAMHLRVLASSGKLLLKLWINDRGQVVQAETEKSELPAEFAAATAAAFKQARFSPGERTGMPVGSIIRIEVDYHDTRRSS